MDLSEIDEVLRHSGNIGLRFKVLDLLNNPTQGRHHFSWNSSTHLVAPKGETRWATCIKCGFTFDLTESTHESCYFDEVEDFDIRMPIIGSHTGGFALSKPVVSDTNRSSFSWNFEMAEYAQELNAYMYAYGTLDGFDPFDDMYMEYMNHIPWTHNLDDPRLEQWDENV